MTTTSLTWKRRETGTGIYAEGAEHRYYAHKVDARTWAVEICQVATTAGHRVVTAVEHTEHVDTQALAKGFAAAFEADVDAEDPTKRAQNRVTRAIGSAYDA